MLYVLHGPESFLRDQVLAKLKARVGSPDMADLNIITLAGKGLTLSELIHVCDAIPFLSDRRMVVVKGLASSLSGKQGQGLLEQLEEYLPTLPETTDLVLVEEDLLNQRSRLLKLAAKCQAKVKAFPQLKGHELNRWIEQRAQEMGLGIEPAAVRELGTYVGNNLRLLALELEKLAAYAGETNLVTLASVRELVSYVREENIFDLVDSLGQRDGVKAIGLLQHLLDEGKEPLYLFAMMTRQFRLIIQTKVLMQKRAPRSEIMKALGIRHRFIVDKMLRQARNFSLPQLKSLYRELQRIDVRIKTGRVDANLALEVFVANVCHQRRVKV
jgi:DNA polymerase-3 subunit delta